MNLLISPDDLAELMGHEAVVLVDTRDPTDYEAGHLPGAVNLREIFTYLATSDAAGLADLHTRFADWLGQAGISGEETVVIYEDALHTGNGQSCRGYFLLTYLGHPRVRVLEGGLQAWLASGGALSQAAVQNPVRRFKVRPRADVLVTAENLLAALDNPNIAKLDVRDYPEWAGESSSPYSVDFAPRKGRIPGAVWIEWRRLLDLQSAQPSFQSPEYIRTLTGALGIDPQQPVYLYCFKGARAANSWMALKLAGFSDVRLYLGSWNEWSRHPDWPIEEGEPDPAREAA